jgi:hypothetical protein
MSEYTIKDFILDVQIILLFSLCNNLFDVQA